MVDKMSKSKDPGKTDCRILEIYNDMLKETFNYEYVESLEIISGSKMDQQTDSKQEPKPNLKSRSIKFQQGSTSKHSLEHLTAVQESRSISYKTSDINMDNNETASTNMTVSGYKKIYKKSNQTHVQNRLGQEKSKDRTFSDLFLNKTHSGILDCAKKIIETDNVNKPKSIKSNDTDKIRDSTKDRYISRKNTGTISFGVCFISKCVKTDIFSLKMSKLLKSKQRNKDVKTSETKIAYAYFKTHSSRKACCVNNYLHYFSKQRYPSGEDSRKDFILVADKNVTRNKSNTEIISKNDSMKVEYLESASKNQLKIIDSNNVLSSRNEIFVDYHGRNVCSGKRYFVYSFRHCLSSQNIRRRVNKSNERDKTFIKEKNNKAGALFQECHYNKNGFFVHLARHCLSIDKPICSTKRVEVDVKQGNLIRYDYNGDTNPRNAEHKEEKKSIVINRNIQNPNKIIQVGKEELTSDQRVENQEFKSEDSKIEILKPTAFPYEKMRNLILIETTEYNKKIQTLELMIFKLENQVLKETFEKQNHSLTMMRFENTILKLENDYLRMSKNYDILKQENEILQQQHKNLFEMTQKENTKRRNYQELPDITTEGLELISNHQFMIKELSEAISNQSILVKHIKRRLDNFQEETYMMRQMMTNHTIVLELVMQSVADLTEKNLKCKEELKRLRAELSRSNSSQPSHSSFQSQGESDNFMKDLNLLASDENIKIENIEVKTSINEPLKLEPHGSHWCMFYTSRSKYSCYYYSVVNVINRVPYRRLFWWNCSDTLSAKYKQPTNNIVLPDVSNTIPTNVTEKENQIHNDEMTNQRSVPDLEENPMDSMQKLFISEEESLQSNNPDDTFKDINEAEASALEFISNEQIYSPLSISSTCIITKIGLFENVFLFKSSTDKNCTDKREEVTTQKNLLTEKGSAQMSRTLDKEKKIIPYKMIERVKSDSVNVDTSVKENLSQVHSDVNSDDNIPSEIINKYDSINLINDRNKDEPVFEIFERENEQQKNSFTVQSTQTHINHTPNKDTRTDANNAKQENIAEEKERKQFTRKIPIHLDEKQQQDPQDCYDHYKSGSLRDGVYKVKPKASDKVIQVFCDMLQGGWTLIQRRQDGSTSFFQDWETYKEGFGGVYGEHWLGNDNIHLLTNQGFYHLHVDLGDWTRKKRYAFYEYFLVDSEQEGYRLHVDGYSGDAGDGLSKHNGSKFSTKDVDNDKVIKEFGGSCAQRFHGAWWYFKCYSSNLNGKYYKSGKIPEKLYDGVTWKPWTGPNYSLRTVQMKIRPAYVNH